MNKNTVIKDKVLTMPNPIKNIVIVGGGSAGWMSAAMLSRVFGTDLNITLIESEQIGTVGVGEATIPPIQQFNNILGIEEHEFIKQTQGTYKLAIQFENWGKLGESYMHTFGGIGKDLNSVDFHHYWLATRASGSDKSYWDYSINYKAATQNKYDRLDYLPNAKLAGLVRAYHFDAGLYAQYLRRFSELRGVVRVEGKITQVNTSESSGNISSVELENGNIIGGDLFIDCTGFKGLLIEDTLKTGYEDWSEWLPCDRAIAIPTEMERNPVPYTRSIAHEAGWQWQIPLQHRVGNGMVYCSDYWDEDKALATLQSNLPGKPLKDPNFIRFTTGRRRKQWNKNVVSVGLSSGFLEPLESTSLHLIQTAIMRLVRLFPQQGIAQSIEDEFNRQSETEYEQIRDFLILHYHLNQRDDSAFWQRCQSMNIPDSLQHKMDLFKHSGRVFRQQDDLFTEVAWYQVMMGQNLLPDDYHPLAERLPKDKLHGFMESLESIAVGTASKMPTHMDYINKHCAANR